MTISDEDTLPSLGKQANLDGKPESPVQSTPSSDFLSAPSDAALFDMEDDQEKIGTA